MYFYLYYYPQSFIQPKQSSAVTLVNAESINSSISDSASTEIIGS